jgi:adenosine deaminase
MSAPLHAVTVFVNERAVEVARGATVRDAVRSFDRGLADLLGGAAYVTDARGLPVDAGDAIAEAGAVFRVVVSAKRAGRLTKETLRRWPKAELHVHLDGCLRPATMIELAREQGVRLPADTPAALAQALSVKDARNLEDYLDKYRYTVAVMQTAGALERVAYEFVQDVAAENVRYVEMRYSPLLHRPALSLAEAIEAPLRGVRRAQEETGTRVGVIVCAIRSLPPAASLELASAAADYRQAGVVAFDLAGPERGFPAAAHRQAFEAAARHGLACTCHAGEGDGPAQIHEALHVCGATRIGHGTRLGEDAKLLEQVVALGVPLEMCITSNVHTHAVRAVEEHPLRRYLERGVRVTLSTDGRLMDGVTLTDELYLAHTALGAAPTELARMMLNACEAAFLPDADKVALVARMQSELEAVQ